jgi:predicted transposase YbfD/YdcC
VAIDGKTSRRTHAHAKGCEPLHMVSAWATRQRLVLGQEAVADKFNEIRAIPALLERLELKGPLVTINAMGAQSDIAERIVEGGGDYLLALKANRRFFFTMSPIADPKAERIEPAHLTLDADHGRIEERRHVVSYDVDWLFSSRRYAHEPCFPISP